MSYEYARVPRCPGLRTGIEENLHVLVLQSRKPSASSARRIRLCTMRNTIWVVNVVLFGRRWDLQVRTT
jgi:hypothetical protein